MRRFNPDRELYKIRYGKRDKIVLGIILLLVIVSISSTFALYQVRHSKRIIYTTVSDFTANNKDVILAVYYDDEKKDSFPPKNTGYVYLKTDCDNNSEAYFDTNSWSLYLNTKGQDKCNVYFVKNESTPNVPELYQGLIPVVFDDSGNMTVADTTSEWYNYDEHRWANAVLVNSSNYNKYVKNKQYVRNATIPMSEVLQMYVWIPRYKYQLFNVNNEAKDEQMINIIFENGTSNTGDIKCTYTNENNGNIKEECINKTTNNIVQNGEWYTHPAFTFGNTELTGIWIGKFETSGSVSDVRVVPNARPIASMTLVNYYNAVRNIDVDNNKYNLNSNEIDAHLIKNIEWGLMAYLAQSKYGRCDSNGNCEEITNNDNPSYTTGYASTGDQWNTKNGMKASTTGNIYGIYDTEGGSWEYVMGNMVNTIGAYNSSSSGITTLDKKYYDIYGYDGSNGSTSFERGHLGDATREFIKEKGSTIKFWYGIGSSFPLTNYPWFERGGRAQQGSAVNIYVSTHNTGVSGVDSSFRQVITKEDKNE